MKVNHPILVEFLLAYPHSIDLIECHILENHPLRLHFLDHLGRLHRMQPCHRGLALNHQLVR